MIVVIVILMTVPVEMVVIPVALLPVPRIIMFPVWQDVVLSMAMMMWKISIARILAVAVIIRPYSVIVPVHNDIATAVPALVG